MKERKRKGSRQSLSGPVSLVLAPSLFRSCSLVVVLGGLMVGGGWKSIALNNEPQGSTLTPLSTVWSSLSCILSFQTERESNSLYPSRAFPPFPYFPSLSLSLIHRSPSPLCTTRGLPIPSSLLLNTRKEVFVSSLLVPNFATRPPRTQFG